MADSCSVDDCDSSDLTEPIEVSSVSAESSVKGQTPIQLCEICHLEESSDASFVCLDCPLGKHFWCDRCIRGHKVSAPTHRVVYLPTYEEAQQKYPFSEDAEGDDSCPKHKGEKLTHSCRGCEELLCPICVHGYCGTGKAKRSKHDAEPFSNSTAELKAQVYQSLDVAKLEIDQLTDQVAKLKQQKETLSANLEQHKEYADGELNQVIDRMNTLSQELIHVSQDHMNVLLSTVNLRLAEADTALEELKATVSEADVLTTSQNHLEVHRKTPDLAKRLKRNVSGKMEPLSHLSALQPLKTTDLSLEVSSRLLELLLLITHKVVSNLPRDPKDFSYSSQHNPYHHCPKQSASLQCGSVYHLLEAFSSGLHIDNGAKRKLVNLDEHYAVCCTDDGAAAYAIIYKRDHHHRSIRKYKIDGDALTTECILPEKELSQFCREECTESLSVFPGSGGPILFAHERSIKLFTLELELSYEFEVKEIGLSQSIRSSFWGRTDKEAVILLGNSAVALVNLGAKVLDWSVPVADVSNVQYSKGLVYCMQPKLKKMTVLNIEKGEEIGVVQCPGAPMLVMPGRKVVSYIDVHVCSGQLGR